MSQKSSNLKYGNRLKKEINNNVKPKKKEQPHNPLTQIPLSKAMTKYPQFFEEFKIGIVQKAINKIDQLPQRFNSIETLYLSNNHIKSLEGIQQFPNLENLSLANNEIEDISFLRYLKQLQSLQQLNLKGNPVCKHPAYRQLVITILPNLQLFDDQQVTQQCRTDSEIKLKKHNAYLDMLLQNYCDLIQLNSFSRKLDLNKNMITLNYKFAVNDINLSVDNFRNNFKYQEQLDEDQKDILRENLMRDILTLYYEMSEFEQQQNQGQIDQELRDSIYERAFSELIMRQKHKIAELDVKICKKIDVIYKLKAEIRQKFNIDLNKDLKLDQTARFKTDPGSGKKQFTYQYQEDGSIYLDKTFNNNNNRAQTSRQNSPPPEAAQKSILKSVSNQNFFPKQNGKPNRRQMSEQIQNKFQSQSQQVNPKIQNDNINNTNMSRSNNLPQSKSPLHSGQKSPIFIPQDEKDLYSKLEEAQNQLQGLQSQNFNQDDLSQQQIFDFQSNSSQMNIQNQQPKRQLFSRQNNNNTQNNIQASDNNLTIGSNPLIDNLSPIKQKAPIQYPNENFNPLRASPFQSKNNFNKNLRKGSHQQQNMLKNNISQNNNLTQINRSLSPQRNVPQPSIYDSKPNTSTNQSSCRRFRGQGSLSPVPNVKRTITDLERLIQNLQDKLTDKHEQIAILNDANRKYKDKIREFYAQNQSNVVLAQNSLEDMDMQLARKTEMQKILENEVKTLRSEINNLILNNYDLEKEKQRSQQLLQENAQIQEQVSILQEQNQKEQMADNFNQKRLQKKMLQYLNYATKTETLVKAFRTSWDNMYGKQLAFNLISKWKTLTLKKKYVKVKNTHINLGLLSDTFKKWKQNIKFSKNIGIVIKHRQEQQLQNILQEWQWYVGHSKQKKITDEKIKQFRTKKLFQYSIFGFKELLKQTKIYILLLLMYYQ